MLSKLIHRGPDGQGIKNLPNGTLGHRRLAVLDIEGGHQPMGIDNTWITFNGEIYNYRELAGEYLKGESLRTHSDTEVILHLYKKLGPRCVKLLDGMFAFAILDSNGLFLARDPLGIKPLYCSERDGAFYFTSEIKALAEVTSTIYEFPAGYWFHSRTGWHPHFAAEMASKYVKVILTSEGADEIYAGYDYLRSIESPEELQEELLNIMTTLHNTNLQRGPYFHGIWVRSARSFS